uniref:Uncharacterized protein n=1 Tax=Rhizophora mucronata TaxID=61149 RepID=A0A2P2L9Y2_RHIMU
MQVKIKIDDTFLCLYLVIVPGNHGNFLIYME